MSYIYGDDPWKIDKGLTKVLQEIPDKAPYTEHEEKIRTLLKVLDVMAELLGKNDTGKVSAEQILPKLGGYDISSKRDLAMKLATIGLTNRVLRHNNKYGRYYCITKIMLADIRNKLLEQHL